MKKIDIIVPCYNEKDVLPETSRQLLDLLKQLITDEKISDKSRIVFVDDGSNDSTWDIIKNLSESDYHFEGVKLSTNRGHQNALLAGLHYTTADAAISIDADLQDDVNVIPEMVERFLNGADIVYAVRSKRKTDKFLKRFTAQAFYKLMIMMGVNVIYNHADYRLMNRKVLDALKQYNEVNMFLRGVIPEIGFKSEKVFFERNKRFAGEAKYSIRKMLSLALNGITSFSITPLRLITSLGFVIFTVSLLISIWIFYVRFFTNHSIPGWASTTLPIYFIGGIQLLSIGIIGEYIGKIYMETKQRPRYFIDEILKNK